jgi:hypothetical protein
MGCICDGLTRPDQFGTVRKRPLGARAIQVGAVASNTNSGLTTIRPGPATNTNRTSRGHCEFVAEKNQRSLMISADV